MLDHLSTVEFYLPYVSNHYLVEDFGPKILKRRLGVVHKLFIICILFMVSLIRIKGSLPLAVKRLHNIPFPPPCATVFCTQYG